MRTEISRTVTMYKFRLTLDTGEVKTIESITDSPAKVAIMYEDEHNAIVNETVYLEMNEVKITMPLETFVKYGKVKVENGGKK